MGKNSGGSGTGGGGMSAAMRERLSKIDAVKAIKDPELKKEFMEALAEYEKEIGLPTDKIELGFAGFGAYGSTEWTRDPFTGDAKLDRIVMSKGYFQDSKGKQKLKQDMKEEMASGFHPKTDKPLRQSLHHELAHATWTSEYKGQKYKDAGKEIRKLYKQWHKDGAGGGIGRYAKSNVDEFWAETVSASFHGKKNSYTSAARAIIKKYKL